MASAPTPQPPTLQSVFAFLRTDEWKVLVDVFEYNMNDRRKKNLKKAAPFWTSQMKRDAQATHEAWESILEQLQNIKQAMRDLPEWITMQNHHMIRTKCINIRETIAEIVDYFGYMDASFTTYLHNKEYDTVKMKYSRQGPNGLWGGVHVKCGKLFGGVQSLHLLSFLHRIYEVFVVPPDPDPEAYPPRRVTWPNTASIPENFRYRVRESIPARLVANPSGKTPSGAYEWEINAVAIPMPIDNRLEEHSMQSDSSGDERSDDDIDFERPIVDYNSDGSAAHLTSMLRDLQQLSVS
jgi:hypothetical protein